MQQSIKEAVMLILAILAPVSVGQAMTIEDVQRSDSSAGWRSPYAGQVVNVTGGIVTYVGTPPGKRTRRVVIQDTNFSEWAGVEIKVFEGTLLDEVHLGDRLDLTKVHVDESSKARGTTYLLFDPTEYGSGFDVPSSGHTVEPTLVGPSVLGAGDTGAAPENAEKYEGMLLMVENVTVGGLYLGSHNDNYELICPDGTCWASDYINVDRDASQLYHWRTQPGVEYDAVVGILEQYTKSTDGYDYYQILTRSGSDLIPEPATIALLLTGGVALLGRRK